MHINKSKNFLAECYEIHSKSHNSVDKEKQIVSIAGIGTDFFAC